MERRSSSSWCDLNRYNFSEDVHQQHLSHVHRVSLSCDVLTSIIAVNHVPVTLFSKSDRCVVCRFHANGGQTDRQTDRRNA